MDLDFGLKGTVAIVTGGGGQIGHVIVDALLSAGCLVGAFDIDKGKFTKHHDKLFCLAVDTTDEETMKTAWVRVRDHFKSSPTVCICAAALDLSFIQHHSSIINMTTAQFQRTLNVNVTGTFITAKTWLSHIAEYENTAETTIVPESVWLNSDSQRTKEKLRNISLIIIGSEAGELGVPGNPDYAASKSAVQHGLLLSLAPDAARIHHSARVNAICPGAVNTPRFQEECAEDKLGLTKWIDAEATVASKIPVDAEGIAKLCVMLASEKWSGSITGQALKIDGGKSGRLFWGQHGNPLWM